MKKYKSMIDGNGRVVIPKVYRESIGVTNNSAVEVTLEEDKIVIKKTVHTDVCAFCESNKNLAKFKKGFVCKNCIDKIKKCDC